MLQGTESVPGFDAEIPGMLSGHPKAVWLNPEPKDCWTEHPVGLMRRLRGDRMYPLTLDGLEWAMQYLSR